ncbi:uncharacterized protein LOC141595946 [Silene latifolia]|uniref:uncharacterized protein LOC141595946 n=1 Tax=Silene latifolia TaxID=37657 RepID=UPI003D78244B
MSDSEQSSASASSLGEMKDDIPMFSEFPSEENQELEKSVASQENMLNITMSDSEESSASANDSASSKDFSTTQEDIPPSVNTSQALPDMSQSLPERSRFIDLPSESSDEDPPFNLRTLRRMLDDEAAWPARGSFLEVPTDDIPMFSEFPTVENQEMMNQYQLTDDFLSQSSDEYSQEMMLNSTEPSQLNQSPWTFVCHLKSAEYLKFAVEFLSNPELSSQGLGRIDVDDNGFDITVEKSIYYVVGPLPYIYYVVGHLRLNPARFRCTRPLNGKTFSFLGFSQELADVEDEATVYLANRKQTDELNIRALVEGDENTRGIFVDMSSNVAEILKFPDMSLFFTATVPSNDFRQMIQYLLQQQAPQEVSVEITNNTAILRVGIDYSWTATYPMLRADGSRAMEQGESCSISFQWTDAGVAKSLQKASELDAELVVLFHAEQPKFIMLRFSLEGVGYLEFTREYAVGWPL